MENAADQIFQIVPRGTLPHGHRVAAIVRNDTIFYLVDEDLTMAEAFAEMNQYATHIIRHGLWVSQPGQHTPRLLHVS